MSEPASQFSRRPIPLAPAASSPLTTSALTLQEATASYLFELEASGRTTYRRGKVDLALRTFGIFLESINHSGRLEDLTADLIRHFLLWLREGRPLFGAGDPRARSDRGLSARTTNDRLIDLKSFFNWLIREELLARSPARPVRKLPEPIAEIAVLSDQHVAALLSQPDRHTWIGFREYATMALLYDTGLRISEFTGMVLDDILWPDFLLRIWGKGRRERRVPFGDEGRRVLTGWLRRRGEWAAPWVFVSARGRQLNRRDVERMMARHGRNAHITGIRLSPHTLRHTFATHFLRAGGDLFTLQAILGHRGLEMVRRYSHLAERDIRLRHRRFSPLDRLRNPEERT